MTRIPKARPDASKIGVAARSLAESQQKLTEQLTSLAFSLILKVLSWVIELVPFAVFDEAVRDSAAGDLLAGKVQLIGCFQHG